MISLRTEKRLLQMVVGLACLVPLFAGIFGILKNTPLRSDIDLDSHFRYLSGLLLGIGLCYLSTLPHIESHATRFRMLTFIVVIGGISRLIGMLLAGMPHLSMLAALGMELVITPLLCLWQNCLAHRYNIYYK